MHIILVALIFIVASVSVGGTPPPLLFLDPPQCGSQKEGKLCHDNLCCSQWGFCGSTDIYCNDGCQSQCSGTGGTPPPSPPPPSPSPPPPPPSPPPPSPGSGVEKLLSISEFYDMLPFRNMGLDNEFFTYKSFVTAAKTFPEFATTGNTTTQKREIAAFLAQTSLETAGIHRYSGDFWGYYYNIDVYTLSHEPYKNYCIPSVQWPCVTGKDYYGRGPINLKYNTNYGPAGEALGYDLLNNPALLETDATLSFESALWFWMTPQSPKPSCHDVITDNWEPSRADVVARRRPGYGVVTNIINGDEECGIGVTTIVENRIWYYKRYCFILGLSYGTDLDCFNQVPFDRKSLVGNTYIE